MHSVHPEEVVMAHRAAFHDDTVGKPHAVPDLAPWTDGDVGTNHAAAANAGTLINDDCAFDVVTSRKLAWGALDQTGQVQLLAGLHTPQSCDACRVPRCVTRSCRCHGHSRQDGDGRGSC